MSQRTKFRREDEKYLSSRRAFSDAEGPQELWSLIDHWPLYVGNANLARFLAIYEILRDSLQVPGDVVEFGSWRGANAMFLAKALKILDPTSMKRVHAFDSFEGLSTFSREDGEAGDGEEGQYRATPAHLQAMIELYEFEDYLVVHSGDILNTLPEFLNEHPEASFSLVYCDTDLYEPTRAILQSMHDRLSVGGAFVLDQWNFERFPGETVAVREFLERAGDSYVMEHVPRTRQPSLLLRKTSP